MELVPKLDLAAGMGNTVDSCVLQVRMILTGTPILEIHVVQARMHQPQVGFERTPFFWALVCF